VCVQIKDDVDMIERNKDEEMKRFQSHGIHFDFGVLVRIKECVVDLSSSCMELALEVHFGESLNRSKLKESSTTQNSVLLFNFDLRSVRMTRRRLQSLLAVPQACRGCCGGCFSWRSGSTISPEVRTTGQTG
jgi:hypothetical protein